MEKEKETVKEAEKATEPVKEPETAGESAEAARTPEQEIVQRAVPEEAEGLRRELESARERVTQLERERWLMARGVPEEDLDYCVYKIGKMTGEGKDFAAAAKEFLQARSRRAAPLSTGASLAGRTPHAPGPNETMNRIIRGTSP